MKALGIDVGGSGIKGAPVELETGELLAPRFRLETPQPSTIESVADIIRKIAGQFQWTGQVGIGVPAVVIHGVTYTAANIHENWINAPAQAIFQEATGCPVHVLNDADAAGMAEMKFGAGQGHRGVVLIITVGTGLGTSLFSQGCLVPNTELGHIELNGKDAETRASDAARQRDELSWSKWAARFNRYLQALEHLVWPDLFIIGGGVSDKFHKFAPHLTVRAQVVPAQLKNEAGIVGAALASQLPPDM